MVSHERRTGIRTTEADRGKPNTGNLWAYIFILLSFLDILLLLLR